MVRVTAFMACSKAYLWALHVPYGRCGRGTARFACGERSGPIRMAGL